MKSEPHLDNSSGLSPEQLEAIMRTARQQAAQLDTTSDKEFDWRLLGYVVLAGCIVVVLAMQMMG